jgi:error-prone DNA polymerase
MEVNEPAIALRPMTAGGEVVEDYGHVGLTLRDHPVSFLRDTLSKKRILTCAGAVSARDSTWLETAGLVLVRQRPGSAKGVMFITIEDETGIANIVVWRKIFEKYRRVVLSSGMIGIYGKIQREGAVVHLVAHRLSDLSSELASIGQRHQHFPPPPERDDGFHHRLPSPDHNVTGSGIPLGPDTQAAGIKLKTRDFK